MRAALSLPSFLFRQGVWLRGQLYDHGWLSVKRASCPVVSVGNLTTGGTGKTPFSIWLLDRLAQRGLSVGYVSRGYRSGATHVRAVGSSNPEQFGDEPSLLRDHFPKLPIYIGAARYDVIGKLLSDQPVQLVVADDAFQHRRLARDLDVVLLDAMEPAWHYDFLPQGRAREGFDALARAQVVVLSKFNLASPEQIRFLETRLAGFRGIRLRMNYITSGFERGSEKLTELQGSAFLVSGVGRPEGVSQMLRRQRDFEIVQHKIFPDHRTYTVHDVRAILSEFRASGAKHLVTTEKDAVKLRRFEEMEKVLWQVNLSIQMEGQVDELDGQIDRLVRPRA